MICNDLLQVDDELACCKISFNISYVFYFLCGNGTKNEGNILFVSAADCVKIIIRRKHLQMYKSPKSVKRVNLLRYLYHKTEIINTNHTNEPTQPMLPDHLANFRIYAGCLVKTLT